MTEKMTDIKTALIDGYLDEPSALGVPPYISPHIRYLFGALVDGGISREDIDYFTADGLRERMDFRSPEQKESTPLEDYDLVLVMAGTTVPGNYLRGRPLSLAEIGDLSHNVGYPTLVLCGPITMVLDELPGSGEIRHNFDIISGELAAADIYLRLCRQEDAGGSIDPDHLASDLKSGGGEKTARALGIWARHGAELFSRHPHHPRLVAELETYRGCPRQGHCKFCSEQLKQISYQRRPEQIIAEVEAIASRGVHNYRLGCQADLLGYSGENSMQSGKKITLQALEELYSGIHGADGELNALHLDNINPGPLARNPGRGRKALEIITAYNTPGDVAAFGLESADPRVLKANNIDTDVELTLEAIRMVNEIGGRKQDGIPKLLPGINFLYGLKGERPQTYRLNFEFLERVREEDLLLRRINVRQVNPLGRYESVEVDRNRFEEFKQRVNQEINKPMLQKVFPRGTLLTGLWPEKREGKLTYARQPGSYPILVGIPGDHMEKEQMKARVIDHGYRSITALAHPFYVDQAGLAELEQIPGIGSSRASRIMAERPQSPEELRELLGPSFPWQEWREIFSFSTGDR